MNRLLCLILMFCDLGEYDIGVTASDGTLIAGPSCHRCNASGLVCLEKGALAVPFGYYATVSSSSMKHSETDGGRNVNAYLCTAPGMCCQTRPNCAYDQSCAFGRDPLSPLCGRCLTGYSEAFGTASCLRKSQLFLFLSCHSTSV